MNAIVDVNFTHGLIEGLSNSDYHNSSRVSSSALKDFGRSPLHYWSKHLNPDREQKEQTPAMVLGSAVHTLFLEPELFGAEYAIAPKCDRRTKEGKALYEQFCSESFGKTILTDDQSASATKMAAALTAHPIHDIIMKNSGFREASIFFSDPDTGITCRIRPDWCLPPCERFPNGLILDVKSTDDARPYAFSRSCHNFGYDLSAAMYRHGFQEYFKTEQAPDFLFLVVEKEEPHATACYAASDEFLLSGIMKYRDAMLALSACTACNEWNGYSQEITEINLPQWA